MSPADSGRYFVDDEPALAAKLDQFLSTLATDLGAQPWREDVAALVLAGGYGRGEGGVFRASEKAEADLYNDLEFFLFLKSGASPPPAAAWCERWERDGTVKLGIDVEFKRDAATGLQHGAPTMFLYDLLQGHRVIWGDPGCLARAPARLRDPAAIPAEEATRLLFNRGSGLWFAQMKLAADAIDELGFVERNQQKAKLAMGDAVLALSGRHHAMCEERDRRIASGGFATPPDWAKLVAWHDEGTAFKLRPRHRATGLEHLKASQTALVAAWLKTFLWVEGRRLDHVFTQPLDYVAWDRRLFPNRARWRNVAVHARDRFKRGEMLRAVTDYPRATLQRALVAALVDGTAAGARCMGVTATDFDTTYARWWARYN